MKGKRYGGENKWIRVTKKKQTFKPSSILTQCIFLYEIDSFQLLWL